jgi:hypothetical protein
MSVQDFIAVLIVAVAAAFAARTIWRSLHAGCGSGCGKCGSPPASTSPAAGTLRSDGIIRKPLITQIGLPEKSDFTDV